MPRTVLIADDNLLARSLLRDCLQGLECTITEALDGEQALAALSTSPPDVLLLDLVMPRVSGLDVLRAIKEKGLRTRVLVISGMDTQSLSQQTLVEGAHGFIGKPFHPLEVKAAVEGAFAAFAGAAP
jgi:two-component system, chemotaxis family, chemotaxis protein CheY